VSAGPWRGRDSDQVTVQIADCVDLAGQAYGIAGVEGGPLFVLAAHDIKPGLFSRRYIIWRNNHTYDEKMSRIVDRANVAFAAPGWPDSGH
jgi:hypothetical protein